jgi:hypothetical protein
MLQLLGGRVVHGLCGRRPVRRPQVCAVRQTGAFAEEAVAPLPAVWRLPSEP